MITKKVSLSLTHTHTHTLPFLLKCFCKTVFNKNISTENEILKIANYTEYVVTNMG